MKIAKNKINSKKLLELHLIKSRIYETAIKTDKINVLHLSKTMLSLKKSLSVIFNFHKNRKRILFVGAPKLLEEKINHKTIHSSIPEFIKVQGISITKSLIRGIKLKSRLKKKNRYILSKITNKPDLIVVLKSSRDNNLLINESYASRIPLIQFEYNIKEHNTKHLYNVPGNLKASNKDINSNILLLFLNSMLIANKK